MQSTRTCSFLREPAAGLSCTVSSARAVIVSSLVPLSACLCPPPPSPNPDQGRFLYLLWFFILPCTYSSLRFLNAHTEGARGDQVGRAKSASRSNIKGNLLVGPKKQEHKARDRTTAWVRCCLHFFLTFKFCWFLAKQSSSTPFFCCTAWHMGS